MRVSLGFAGLGDCVNGIDSDSGDPCSAVVQTGSSSVPAGGNAINVTGLTAAQIAALATGINNPVFVGTYTAAAPVTNQLTAALSANSTWLVAGCAIVGLLIAMGKK